MNTHRSFQVLLFACLLTAGCGLSDYENTLAFEQKRLQEFDELNKHLADQVELPSENQPLPFFFRPPKGISSKPEDTRLGNLLLRFTKIAPPKPTGFQPKPAKTEAGSGLQDVCVGLSQGKSAGEFQREVLQLFPNADPEKRRDVKKQPFGRPELRFEAYSSEDNGIKSHIFFYREDSQTAVIVFRYDAAKWNERQAEEEMDYSLKSLRWSKK